MPDSDTKPKIAVLISGGGSNLQALIDAHLNAEIGLVISNQPNVKGLERAQSHGIPCSVISHKEFDSRDSFDHALAARLIQFAPDLVILAGFMRILTPEFVTKFIGKLVNIHPSLLPKYPGLHTHQRAIDAGDQYAGATIHYVTAELDGGPAIAQAKLPIAKGDTADTLAKRILAIEHKLYPLAVNWILQKRVCFKNNEVFLDGKLLPKNGYDSTQTLAHQVSNNA